MRNCDLRIASIAMVFALAPCLCGAQKLAWTKSAAVIEREPGVEELAAYPPDAQTLRVNPPGFTWTPNEKAKTYRLEVRRASQPSQSILSTEPLSSTVGPLPRAFDPGEYVWQVVYLDAGGAVAGASKARRFKVPPGIAAIVR